MRGKACTCGTVRGKSRITPAYAGKSYGSTSFTLACEDHPRLCGEKLLRGFLFRFLLGSPPPMRGKVVRHAPDAGICRITPAYAGKSQKGAFSAGDNQDHPRLCGEKVLLLVDDDYFRGSPPPMRGKVMVRIPEGANVGITPAYAGKSWR